VQNEKATEATFKGGWLNTGDLAVQHKYGRIQIRDRSKDVIIR
jgi:fatty-acyl-CoA synthase